MERDAHRRILLVGGGTGGHFYPLIAIAEAIAKGGEADIYYAGPSRYDADALRKAGIGYIAVPAGKTRRYRSVLNVFDPFLTLIGALVALLRLYILYPDVVVSKGGYTSVPVIIAAAFLRIPIIVHESDSVIGRANRLAIRFARLVIVSYDETIAQVAGKRVEKLGIPVREELLAPVAQNAREALGIPAGRPLVFVTGGSQGAERVNQLILDSLDELLPDYTIVHQTGKANFEVTRLSAETLITNESLKAYYRPTPFLDAATLNDVYGTADIIVSRAGSTSIYEIALHGKPAILIPIPEEISHDQRSNAYAYARAGAAVVLEEANVSDALLRAEIDRIMQDKQLYDEMAADAREFALPDSALKISALVMEVAREH